MPLGTAVLLHDAGPEVGLGHRRRMEALAAALVGADVDVQVTPVGEPASGDVVVVDSYRERADGGKYRAKVLAAIDDLARDLAVDVLVDPSPGADAGVHRAAGRVLAGPRYALVDPSLGDHRVRAIDEQPRRVLVTTGATAAGNAGSAIASDLARLNLGVEVALVLGPFADDAAPPHVIPVRAPAGLFDDLSSADVVITAGGVTLLESLALGRPTVVVVVAENQRRAAVHAAENDAALLASVEDAALVATRLITDAALRTRLSAAARQLVDGQGARRVATELAARLQTS